MINVTPLVNVTPLASEKLREILVEEGAEGASLRVILMPGPHGGAQYMLALENDPKSDDTVIHADGVSIVIDSDSAPLMQGAEIDFADGLMRSGFVINNPNIEQSGGACACGNEGGCSCGGGGCACGGH